MSKREVLLTRNKRPTRRETWKGRNGKLVAILWIQSIERRVTIVFAKFICFSDADLFSEKQILETE